MGSESILTSIKKLLGIAEDYEQFDIDLVMHINTVFATLHQLGVGPDNGFFIEDKFADWTEFMGDDPRLNLVKSYVHLRVKLLFDPPPGSAVLEAMDRTIKELEWRITAITGLKDTSSSDKEESNNNEQRT